MTSRDRTHDEDEFQLARVSQDRSNDYCAMKKKQGSRCMR